MGLEFNNQFLRSLVPNFILRIGFAKSGFGFELSITLQTIPDLVKNRKDLAISERVFWQCWLEPSTTLTGTALHRVSSPPKVSRLTTYCSHMYLHSRSRRTAVNHARGAILPYLVVCWTADLMLTSLFFFFFFSLLLSFFFLFPVTEPLEMR